MTVTEEARRLSAAVDRDRLAHCRDLRRLQVLASLLVAGEDGSPLHDTLTAHLEAR